MKEIAKGPLETELVFGTIRANCLTSARIRTISLAAPNTRAVYPGDDREIQALLALESGWSTVAN